MVGGLASSAAQMVCSLTLGKKRYAAVEEQVRETAARLEQRRKRFLELSDADAAAFEPLAAAYSRKDISPEEMDGLLEQAAGVPLAILEEAAAMLADIAWLYENGSKLARSDAACAMSMACAAMDCASYNVRINTKLLHDRARAEEIDGRTEKLLAGKAEYLLQ